MNPSMCRSFVPRVLVGVVAIATLSCSASQGDGSYGDASAGAAGAGGGSGAVGGQAGGSESGSGSAAYLPDPGPPPPASVGMFKASKLQSDPNPPALAVSAIFTNPAFNLSTTSSKALLSGYEEVPIDA